MKRVHTTSLMQRAWKTVSIVLVCAGVLVGFSIKGATQAPVPAADDNDDDMRAPFDHVIQRNISTMIREGRRTFRFDTFGDEAFWGETLRLHEALATVSPRTALQFGVKVDVDALPPEVVDAIRHGQLDLDDPATTAALLRLNAVVGLTG